MLCRTKSCTARRHCKVCEQGLLERELRFSSLAESRRGDEPVAGTARTRQACTRSIVRRFDYGDGSCSAGECSLKRTYTVPTKAYLWKTIGRPGSNSSQRSGRQAGQSSNRSECSKSLQASRASKLHGPEGSWILRWPGAAYLLDLGRGHRIAWSQRRHVSDAGQKQGFESCEFKV